MLYNNCYEKYVHTTFSFFCRADAIKTFILLSYFEKFTSTSQSITNKVGVSREIFIMKNAMNLLKILCHR